MVILSLLSFAILFVAWLVAPAQAADSVRATEPSLEALANMT